MFVDLAGERFGDHRPFVGPQPPMRPTAEGRDVEREGEQGANLVGGHGEGRRGGGVVEVAEGRVAVVEGRGGREVGDDEQGRRCQPAARRSAARSAPTNSAGVIERGPAAVLRGGRRGRRVGGRGGRGGGPVGRWVDAAAQVAGDAGPLGRIEGVPSRFLRGRLSGACFGGPDAAGGAVRGGRRDGRGRGFGHGLALLVSRGAPRISAPDHGRSAPQIHDSRAPEPGPGGRQSAIPGAGPGMTSRRSAPTGSSQAASIRQTGQRRGRP